MKVFGIFDRWQKPSKSPRDFHIDTGMDELQLIGANPISRAVLFRYYRILGS